MQSWPGLVSVRPRAWGQHQPVWLTLDDRDDMEKLRSERAFDEKEHPFSNGASNGEIHGAVNGNHAAGVQNRPTEPE